MESRHRNGDGPQAEAGNPAETESGSDLTDAQFTYEFDELERSEGRDLIYHITTIIAERTNTDVSELPPLYETIDPDAFDAFLRYSESSDTRPNRSVEFSYCGYRVRADSTGQVTLRPEPESTV